MIRFALGVLCIGLSVSLLGCGGPAGGPDAASAGTPGDAGRVVRTIDIEALSSMRFSPAAVTVRVGDTVTFRVHNGGPVGHEFFLGTTRQQQQHERLMERQPVREANATNAVVVPPGATAELTWMFTNRGSVLYACHEPGHYAAGMKGTVIVKSI